MGSEGCRGNRQKVQETASNAGGSSAPATSEATAVVVPPPPAIVKPPTITGEARQGQTLTEHPGEWTNNPTSYAYQWQQCDGEGNSCKPISGATKQEYVPVEGDVGHRIRVQEQATNTRSEERRVGNESTADMSPRQKRNK